MVIVWVNVNKVMVAAVLLPHITGLLNSLKRTSLNENVKFAT